MCVNYIVYANKDYDDVINIYVGQSEILNHANTSRIAVGSGEIVTVKSLSDSDQILLVGKKVGVTDLRIWKNNKSSGYYLIKVSEPGAEINKEHLMEQIGHIEGIKIIDSENQLVINGNALREEDVDKIDMLSQEYSNVKSHVTTGGLMRENMIYMDVKVVEVKKNELKNIGINWSDVINGPQYAVINDYNTNPIYRPSTGFDLDESNVLSTNVGSHNPYFGISSNLTSIVNLLANDGMARLLAEPQLSCKSGGRAEFLAGGEVPLPVRDKDGSASVTFKQYGIILKIEPVSDPGGYISTHVSVEISTVDESLKVQEIPGFLTRKTETDMNVNQGETMVISGLVNTESAKAVDKLPGLGNIPVLGELFKSRSFRKNETEMIILVTPHVIDPENKINKDWIKRAQNLERTSSEELQFNILD